MSKLDELVSELCPEGVDYKTLGVLLETIPRGKRLTKSDLPQGGSIPVFHGGLEPIGFTDQANTPAMTVMVINVGASAGNVGWSEKPFWCSDGCFALPHSNLILPKYLYYCASTNQRFFVDKVRKAGIPTLAAASVLTLGIPVPPLQIQREIVSILDKFTQLEAELEARKSQFIYFVDRIFDLHGSHNAPSKPLQSVCRITRASGLEKSQLQGEGLPVVQYGEIHMHYDTVATSSRSFAEASIANKLQKANPGDVILVTTSEDVKDVGNPLVWMGSTSIGVGGESLILQHDLDPVYLGMFFKSNSFYSQKLPYVNGSKVKRISTSNLQKILIPVPELRVQKILGENLLALENLVKSANDGLPTEIAARRKQYEHYRNKLLTFKELETA
jgi:type I restriction enzyme S subunit